MACPVEGCHGQEKINMGLRVHFVFRCMQDTMVIMAEETPPTHAAHNVTCWYQGLPLTTVI